MKSKKLAEIKVSYSTKIPSKERPQVTSSTTAYHIFKQYWNKDTIELQEEFNIMYLNRANRVLGIYNLSKGGIAGTVVDARIIFGVAVKCNAVSLILGHNHPSSNLKPSQADIDLTRKLIQAGKTLDIVVLDHLIVTKEGFYSMADEGVI
jgi:DNA repair protein RadC